MKIQGLSVMLRVTQTFLLAFSSTGVLLCLSFGVSPPEVLPSNKSESKNLNPYVH